MTATVVPSVIVNLKVLSQDNYEDWSFRVKTYLLAERLWKVVEVTTEPPKLEEGEDKFEAWSERNAKALHTIHISCGDNAYAFIKGISMAKVAWDVLAEKFKPTEVSHNADVRSDPHTNQTLADGDAGPKKDMEIEAVEDGRYLHKNQSPVNVDAGRKKDKGIQAVKGGDSMNGNLMNGAFLKYLNDRKWDAVMEFIKRHPEAVIARHPSSSWTALHYAVMAEEVDIVKELVQLMTVENLAIKNKMNNTALGSAITGNDTDKMIEIVKCLVEKNKKLLTIVDSANNIPLVGALMLQKWKMASCIYSVTPLETLNDTVAAELISLGFRQKCLDIPLDLIRHKPRLCITKDRFNKSPLFQFADTRSAFSSGSQLRFWQQWIYDCIHVEPTPTKDIKKEPTTNTNDTCINVETLETCQGNQRHRICSGICNAVGYFFQELVVKNLLQLVGIDCIYQMKLFHVQALEILHRICEVLKTIVVDQHMQDDILVPAIFRAVELGQVEFMTHISKANPVFRNTKFSDVHGRSWFQFAAECRQEKIYNLIYELNEQNQKYFVGRTDKNRNNILHAIGFSQFAQIDHIRGAALQMQRELQWFKEVESIARPHHRETINNVHQKAHELFTKSHKELVEKGEKSIKETSTSCTVVGALIVTIMFASAFTVPGGNSGDTGFPIFLNRKAFKIFIASDAISLFFSTTSVMIFLGMLTSRYSQDDFLKSLPKKMMLGLLTLFISIAAMMIAFSSALFLMLPGESWIVVPVVLLSTVPIASFVWMQFPLLLDIFISTYGAGPFHRKVHSSDKDTKQKSLTEKFNIVTKICSSFLLRNFKQWIVDHK